MEKNGVQSGFTPGPWKVEKVDYQGTFRIRGAILGEAQNEGNLRLIQEAPSMFSALEELTDALDNALMIHIFENEKEAAESWYTSIIENARTILDRAAGQKD